MESWAIIIGIPVGLVALILWSGRNDFGDSALENTLRGLYVIGAIVAVAGAIIWVGTYGN